DIGKWGLLHDFAQGTVEGRRVLDRGRAVGRDDAATFIDRTGGGGGALAGDHHGFRFLREEDRNRDRATQLQGDVVEGFGGIAGRRNGGGGAPPPRQAGGGNRAGAVGGAIDRGARGLADDLHRRACDGSPAIAGDLLPQAAADRLRLDMVHLS